MLEEIRMSKSIKSIEHHAFEGCNRLARVYCAKSKDKVKFAEGNDPIKNAEWIKISGSSKEETITGNLTLDGVKVNSLKDAFKQMKDKNKDYRIVIYSDLKGEKNLTIPKSAKSVTISGNGQWRACRQRRRLRVPRSCSRSIISGSRAFTTCP